MTLGGRLAAQKALKKHRSKGRDRPPIPAEYMESSGRSTDGRLRSPSGDRFGPLLYRRHQRLRSWARGMRVLARYQQAVTDDVRRPVRLLREDSAKLQHFIFDKEGHDFGEADCFFLAVGEAGDFLALDQKLAIRGPNVPQRSGGMAHDADWFAGGDEDSIRLIECSSSARSHIGPWPPG